MELDDDLPAFCCPRCGTTTESRFYGPCQGCRAELVADQAVDARKVDVGRYEPSRNVVPNQVATKE